MTERFSSLGNLSIDDLVFVDGTTRWAVPGGNAVYAALGMAVWNERASVVAPFGPDYPVEVFGDRIDLSHSPRIPRSLRDWGLYEEDGSRHFVFRSETRAWGDFSPRGSDVVSGTSAAHLAPMPWDRHLELIAALRQAGAGTVSVDLDDRNLADVSEAAVAGLVASVDLFLPSRQDARAIFPASTPHEAVRRLREMSPHTPLIVVKCGADGCVAHGAGRSDLLLLPAVPVKAKIRPAPEMPSAEARSWASSEPAIRWMRFCTARSRPPSASRRSDVRGCSPPRRPRRSNGWRLCAGPSNFVRYDPEDSSRSSEESELEMKT